MSEDQFTKLFKYMGDRFSDMDKRFDKVDEKVDNIQGTLDSFAKQLLELNQEHLMLSRKVDRIES